MIPKRTIRTLPMLKMEKNFVAFLKKKYPRQPYVEYNTFWLFNRVKQEVHELSVEIEKNNYVKAMEECADISNLIDYLFERLSRLTYQEDLFQELEINPKEAPL